MELMVAQMMIRKQNMGSGHDRNTDLQLLLEFGKEV